MTEPTLAEKRERSLSFALQFMRDSEGYSVTFTDFNNVTELADIFYSNLYDRKEEAPEPPFNLNLKFPAGRIGSGSATAGVASTVTYNFSAPVEAAKPEQTPKEDFLEFYDSLPLASKSIHTQHAWSKYRDWCEDNSVRVVSEKTFCSLWSSKREL